MKSPEEIGPRGPRCILHHQCECTHLKLWFGEQLAQAVLDFFADTTAAGSYSRSGLQRIAEAAKAYKDQDCPDYTRGFSVGSAFGVLYDIVQAGGHYQCVARDGENPLAFSPETKPIPTKLLYNGYVYLSGKEDVTSRYIKRWYGPGKRSLRERYPGRGSGVEKFFGAGDEAEEPGDQRAGPDGPGGSDSET